MTETISDPSKTVHIGRDGYLFLAGGGHGVFSYFSGERDAARGSVEMFVQNITDRAEACLRKDRLFRQVVFPEKCAALSDRVMAPGPFGSLYRRCYAGAVAQSDTAPQVLYPLEALASDSDNFTRTDTHYSALGNLTMTRNIMSGIFPDLCEGLDARVMPHLTEKEDYSGDLGRKFSPWKTEAGNLFFKQLCPSKSARNGIMAGNEGILILNESPESLTDFTLLIFGDSFFRQLLPLLALFYRRIVFCRTRYFHHELVEAFAPDHIFCGLAERYLSRCFSDAIRPHFLSYPLLLGRQVQPDPEFPDMWREFVDQKALLR